MAKRKHLQELFEVDRLLEPQPVEPASSSTIADLTPDPPHRPHSALTQERTIGFDDELSEQSTEGELFPTGRKNDPTLIHATDVRGVSPHLETAPHHLAPIAPPRRVHYGVWLSLLVVLSSLFVVSFLLLRPPQVATDMRAEPPRVLVSPEPRVAPQARSEPEPTASEPEPEPSPVQAALAPPEPSQLEPRATRRSSRPRRVSPGRAERETAGLAEPSEAAAAASFEAVQTRRRRLLSRRALRWEDLKRLGVPEQILTEWEGAKSAGDAASAERSLNQLESELASVVIDREFLEHRLTRVLRRTRARAKQHPEDDRTRSWESEYFELRKSLLDPSITPSSRRSLELNAQIDALERRIAAASSR